MRAFFAVCFLIASLGAPAQEVRDEQWERIDAVIAHFAPAAGDEARVFFLGFAGYGKERVFAEEIKLAASNVGARLGSTERSLLLINDRRTREPYPIATIETLRYALGALAKVMNRENDVLFLALSSHGSRGAMIEVSNVDMPPHGLSAALLAGLLREADIRWKVVVVSACYSGSFIAPLADDHTIVLTAASKTRSSFGCSDDRELTYFGEAFYRDALPRAPTLRAAFEAARSDIRRREKQERMRSSRPQSYFGPLLETKLEELAAKR